MSTPSQHWVTPTQLWHLLPDAMPRAKRQQLLQDLAARAGCKFGVLDSRIAAELLSRQGWPPLQPSTPAGPLKPPAPAAPPTLTLASPRATTPAPAPITSAPVTRAPVRRPPPRPDHRTGPYIERRQLASELAKLTPEQREWFDEQMQVEKAIDPDGWLHRDVAVDLLIELDLNAT